MTAESSSVSAELSSLGLTVLGPGNDCDREPIHLSGAIQPHGLLLAVDETLVVRICSANVAQLFRIPDARFVIGISLGRLAGAEMAATARRLFAMPRPQEAPPELVLLPPRDGMVRAEQDRQTYELVAHRSGGLLVLEIEPAPAVIGEALGSFYQTVRRTMSRLTSPGDVEALCDATIREVRHLIGFDRVMAYRFDESAHGEVVAESCGPNLEPYLGLRYPATDIPRQARSLYLKNWVRLIADVQYTPVPLVGDPAAFPGGSLDLSLASLRSVSPVHLEYLTNMGVRASLSISIIVDGALWGLIACHHLSPVRVSQHVMMACEALGQLLSLQIRDAESRQAQVGAVELARQVARVVTTMAVSQTVVAGAAETPEALLGVVRATGVVMAVAGQRVRLGELPPDVVLDEIVLALTGGSRPVRAIANDNLAGLLTGPGDSRAGGVLLLPLQDPDHQGYLLWVRQEQQRTVRWAGRPITKVDAESGSPRPRNSFAEWLEILRGTSSPWQPAEVTSAEELGRAIDELLLSRSANRWVWLALHDPVTGLPNRTMLGESLSSALENRVLTADAGIGLLIIDLAGPVNPAAAGTVRPRIRDDLLTVAAGRLSSVMTEGDLVTWYDRDRFAVLLEGVVDRQHAPEIANRVANELRETGATISIGVVVATESLDPPAGPAELLRRAERTLAGIEPHGPDRIAEYDAVADIHARNERLVSELHGALERGELTVRFQPMFSLTPSSQRLVGSEALLRWEHPERGLLPPEMFIDVAQETGLILPIGEQLLATAVEQLITWQQTGLTMAVSIPIQILLSDGFPARVLGLLAGHDVDPARLSLEVSEPQVMTHLDAALPVLAELKDAGARVTIADFGTGFSSLARVRTFRADVLKINRSFVHGLPDESRDRAVIASIVRLADELGMEVSAEDVENSEQRTALWQLGCDGVQGPFLGDSVSAGEFVDLALTARLAYLRGSIP